MTYASPFPSKNDNNESDQETRDTVSVANERTVGRLQRRNHFIGYGG